MTLLLAVCLPLLWASLIRAQCDGRKTISSNTDAESINQCQAYNGDILIDAGASGDIYLNGIQTINGSLTAANATRLTSLNADNITSISGNLVLSDLPTFNNFGFPLLEHVQTLTWTDLPSLQGLSFETGLTEADSIYISNTGLINLSGFTPVVIGSIDVNNNPDLETVDFNELENATSSLSFQDNAQNLIIQFESLQFVSGNLTFRNISGLSVPDLQNVTGFFTCYSCAMTTFRATWLQNVGEDFAFVNTDLQSLEFPDLVWVGGNFQLSNNSQLTELSGFTMLYSVQESMILNGVFDSVDFSSLYLVQGDVEITTTSSNQSICDVFNTFRTDEVVHGSIECQLSATGSEVSSSNTTGSTSDNDSNTKLSMNASSHGPSAGAIAGIVIGILTVVACVGAAFFHRRRRAQRKQRRVSKLEIDGVPARAQLPGSHHEEKAELYVDPRNVAEMKGQANYAAEIDSLVGTASVRTAKEIPGVHEAEGDSAQSPMERRNTTEVTSPVSPMDGTLVSASSPAVTQSGSSRTLQ